MTRKPKWLLAATALVSLWCCQSYAQNRPDPAVSDAKISPAPSIYPGGVDTFQVTVWNHGLPTSNPQVTFTISFAKLDFPGGVFNPATDVYPVIEAGIPGTPGLNPFTFTYDPSIKTLTGTLSANFPQATVITYRIVNLHVLVAAPNFPQSVGANVNIVAPGALNLLLTNDNTSAFTNTTSPLPVTLTHFEAKPEGCAAKLSWATGVEEKFDYFGVEKGKDGRTFAPIGQVKATGSNSEYSYTDPAAGNTAYYRLKMVDLDGTYEYSDIRNLRTNCDNSTGRQIQFQPNPTSGRVTAKGLQPGETVRVLNGLGKELLQRKAEGADLDIDLSGYTSGLYLFVVSKGSEVIQKSKVIKSR